MPVSPGQSMPLIKEVGNTINPKKRGRGSVGEYYLSSEWPDSSSQKPQ